MQRLYPHALRVALVALGITSPRRAALWLDVLDAAVHRFIRDVLSSDTGVDKDGINVILDRNQSRIPQPNIVQVSSDEETQQ